MADDFGEKTEAPTPRRRSETREEGNIAKSTDLSAALMLLAAVLLLSVFGMHLFGGMKQMLEIFLGPGLSADVTRAEDIGQYWAIAGAMAAEMIAPIAVGLVVLIVTTGLLQTGFLLTGKALTPKFSRLNPITGTQQLFSLRSLVRLAMSILKTTVVLGAAGYYVYDDLPRLLALVRLDTGPLLAAAAGMVWWLALKVAVLLLVLGVIDYAYQRWQHEQDLKMTKQEVKEEYKRMEGDPLVKQRRAKVARQLAMQRLQRDVPKADVIVANPTHFAVALQYDSDAMRAPKVVAKGADFLALRIRQLAVQHGIPIVQRPPLARALYKHVEVGQEIPAEHYAAVAEILAYVYRLSGKRSA